MADDKAQKILKLLWAKKADKNGSQMWLPLIVHLEDVMTVSGLLWNHWLTNGQRQNIIQCIYLPEGIHADEDIALNLVRFLGFIHDIGKATSAFQTQKSFSNSPDLDHNLLERLEQSGLTGIASLSLTNPKVSHHTIAGEFLLTKMGVRKDIASIVGAHHGKPIDSEDLIEHQNSYPSNYWQTDDKNSKVAKMWKGIQAIILRDALEKCGFVSIEALPEVNEMGQVLLSGLVIMADWIASNEYYFPLVPFETVLVDNIQERWMFGWKKWFDGEPLEILQVPSVRNEFQERFGFKPRPFQKEFYQAVQSINNAGIIILEAPMGSGKTEAALAAAEVLMQKAGMGGIYFGLPTQATSNGIFPRVEGWLEEISEEYEQKSTLKLMHGKASLNKLQLELSAGEHIDEDGDSGVYTAEWFAGRKTSILSDNAVGTVDQVLLTALKQKHLALRHLGFSRKVVIIDEVHAYDTYMNVYLSEALRWFGAYNIPVILLSATLPYKKRKDLMISYLRGRGIKKRELTEYEDLFTSSAYPLMTYNDGKQIKQKLLPSNGKSSTIKVIKICETEMLKKLKELLEDGGIAGIIVNTVKRSQDIYEQCKQIFSQNEVMLLHSRFIDTDRVRLENRLIQSIGKNGKRPHRLVVIGTQVLEQSLDIDFDVLFTDLCPIDLFFQRVGRMHRHTIKRPESLQKRKVFVMGTNDQLDFDKGTTAVYSEYYLARTQQVLPEILHLPDDISPLVQKVYGDDKFEWKDGLVQKYENAENEAKDKAEKKENKAQTFRIDDPKLKVDPEKYNLIGWLKTNYDTQSDETACAQVRDTSETVEVNAVVRCGDGYSFFENKEDISECIDQNNIARQVAAHTLRLSEGILCAAAGTVKEAIQWLEEYNISNLSNWQQSPWLKGSLGIIFEPDGTLQFGRIILRYNVETGLSYQKIENE